MKAHRLASTIALLLSGCTGAAPASMPAPTDGPTVIHSAAQTPGAMMSFEVPADALGFNIVVRGDPGAFVGIDSLISPSGVAVVTSYVLAGADFQIALGPRGQGAISVPQDDATAKSPLETGTWQLRVGGIIPAPGSIKQSDTVMGDAVTDPLDVSIRMQRSSDGAFHGGALDLHLYIPDGLVVSEGGNAPTRMITAATAASDDFIGSRVDFFYGELDRLFGVGRGDVAFHALPGSFTAADDGDARTAAAMAANAPAPQGLHVILLNELLVGSDAEAGYTPTAPGAANDPGSPLGAIFVALDGDAMYDAYTILHEMGHFVGLLHSTEYDGTPDLLDDTPVCDPDSKTCGITNLMNPNGPTGMADVSAEQVRVVRGSPIYRATR